MTPAESPAPELYPPNPLCPDCMYQIHHGPGLQYERVRPCRYHALRDRVEALAERYERGNVSPQDHYTDVIARHLRETLEVKP